MIEPDYRGQLWRKARVVGCSNQRPRSYEVETDSGRVLSRNRKHLQQAPVLNPPGNDDQEQRLPKVEHASQQDVSKEAVSPDVQGDEYHTKSGRIVRKPNYLKEFV